MPTIDVSRASEVNAMSDLVHAIRRAAEEHGVPNRFAPGELHAHYRAPKPLRCAQLARLMSLYRECRALGYDVRYEDRHFIVEARS